MKRVQEYLDEHRQQFGLPREGRIHTTILAPWRDTRTARTAYGVRLVDETVSRVIIQESQSLLGVPISSNPWEPSFSRHVADMLPARRGEFTIGSRTFYWSDYNPSRSLLDVAQRDNPNFLDAIAKLATCLLQRQAEQRKVSSEYLDDNHQLFQTRIHDQRLQAAFDAMTSQHFGSLANHAECVCSWTHGDLWIKDVFMQSGLPCIVDWEWATEIAPIGCDVIDLYVSTASAIFGMSSGTAWTGFLLDTIAELKPLRRLLVAAWDSAEMNASQCRIVCQFTLWRCVARVVAQEGLLGSRTIEQYLRVATDMYANAAELGCGRTAH